MSGFRNTAAVASIAALALGACSVNDGEAEIGTPEPSVRPSNTTAPTSPESTVDSADAAVAQQITVTGTGEATGAPDWVTLSLGIEVRAATTTETLATARTSTDLLQQTLLADGVDPSDLQTTTLSVYPDYQYPAQGPSAPSGYVASVTVNAGSRFDDASRLVDDAAAAVGDAFRVYGMAWSVSDPEPLRAEARRAAMDDARATAVQLAETVGLEVGDVVSITEGSPAMDPYMYEGEGGAYAIPFAPGQATVTSMVTVTYQLTE